MLPRKKIALIGANGMLACMLQRSVPKSLELHLFDLPEFDITDRDEVYKKLSPIDPDIVINCAAFTQVDACEAQSEIAFQVNGEGPGYLAAVAKELGSVLVHISTDFVFSGNKKTPYAEEDVTDPHSIYGQSKLQGEQAIIDSDLKDYFIVRTSWLYGPGGGNFVETIVRLAREREELRIVADQTGTPTYTADLADAIWILIGVKGGGTVPASFGVYHYSNEGVCSWYEFACEIIKQMRKANNSLKVQSISPVTTAEYLLPAKRPAYSVLSKDKVVTATGVQIPLWQESLRTYIKSRTS